MSAGSGSASGASEDQVEISIWRSARPARSKKRPRFAVPAALEQRLLGARRRAGPLGLAGHAVQRAQGERVRDVDQHVLDVLVGGAGERRGRLVRAPAALDEPRVAGLPVRERAVDGVVLGRVVEAGLVGQQDREQAVAVGVALADQPAGVGR